MLTTGQAKDYTTGCLLDYECIGSHYGLIADNLSRQKKYMLIQNQFSKQNVLENQKNTNGVNADGTISMSVLPLKKNQRSEVRIFTGKCNNLVKDFKLLRSKM